MEASDRELIVRGAAITGLPVVVVGDGPKDRRPARSPCAGVAVMYADVYGTPSDILACLAAARATVREDP